jgi:hypothetical protein
VILRFRIVTSASCSQNLISRTKDFLCALLRNSVSVVSNRRAQPVLDIPTTKRSAFKVQRFAAQQRDRFGFNFSQVLWCALGIGEVCFGGMA